MARPTCAKLCGIMPWGTGCGQQPGFWPAPPSEHGDTPIFWLWSVISTKFRGLVVRDCAKLCTGADFRGCNGDCTNEVVGMERVGAERVPVRAAGLWGRGRSSRAKAAMLELPTAATGAGVIPAHAAGGRSGGVGAFWGTGSATGPRMARAVFRRTAAETLGSAKMARMASSAWEARASGLGAPGLGPFAVQMGERVAKSGRPQPVGDCIAVDPDGLSGGCGGGTGGHQRESLLLCRG